MDLELSDEQRWLSESVETLLGREDDPARLWARLVDFGALSVGGDDGLGAVELCLIGRALGAHLAPVPYLGSVAVRFAAEPLAAEIGDQAVALAVLEPGASWAAAPSLTAVAPVSGEHVVSGRKAAVEHAGSVPRLAVFAAAPEGPVLAIVDSAAPEVALVPQPAFDMTAPMFAVELVDAPVLAEPLGGEVVSRIATIGTLLAAAEAVGAAGRILDDACRYAGGAPPVRPHDRQLPGAAPPAG